MSETIQHHHHEGSDGCTATGSIDASVRMPVLLLFGNALHWLLVASLLSVIVSIKLVFPGFLGGISFLGYGRLAPMARDLFLYGWASQAAIAAGIWLMARLCGRPLGGVVQVTLINGAIVLWNLAVLLGTLASLAGYSTGVEWLEYPNWASAMLFLSFLMTGIWAVLLFDRRTGERAEAALWYLVAGFCCFPWVYGTANLLLTWGPVRAPAQGPIQAWFCGGFVALWLLPVTIGVLYALLPRLTGEHLHRRNLAPLGFWFLLLLGGWGGLGRLIGGPVPAWMTSAGVVDGVLFLIPVLIVIINLAGLRREGGVPQGTVWPFLRTGLFALLGAGILGAFLSLPDVSAFARFTEMTEGLNQLWILGVVSMTLFGALYECLPGLLGRACWCPGLSVRHYWLTFTGVGLLVVIQILSGLCTGLALIDPVVSFLNITSYSFPFHVLECAAWFFLLAAAATACANFARALAADHLLPKK